MTLPRQSQRFPKRAHVRSRLEFAAVYEQGVRASDHRLSLIAISNDRSTTRLGLAVSKRYGNAVQRNRLKRQLREAFRLSCDDLPSGLDLVVQPRSSGEVKLGDLKQSLISLAKRTAKKLASRNRPSPTEAATSDASAAPGAR